MNYINMRRRMQRKVEIEKLLVDNGWAKKDLRREREKVAFFDLCPWG
jgi:hypothetical protein